MSARLIRLAAPAPLGPDVTAAAPRSPLDPSGLVHRALMEALARPMRTEGFTAPDAPPEGPPAEDILVSWLLSLPAAVDPSEAARRLVDAHLAIRGPESWRGEQCRQARRLMAMLEETARWPAARLARVRGRSAAPRRRRRRGA